MADLCNLHQLEGVNGRLTIRGFIWQIWARYIISLEGVNGQIYN